MNLNWSHVSKETFSPNGFLYAGIKSGLKDSANKDLALIVAPDHSVCSGYFTQSAVRASCVDICEERLRDSKGSIRAVLINSGHANACTGDLGRKHSLLATEQLSKLLNIKADQILMCSTGVIGVPIPIEKLINNLPNLVSELSLNNFQNAAEAILTTDLVTKRIAIKTCIEGRIVKIAAMAKGSGMIYPNMATMLAFLTCDAGIDKDLWDEIIDEAVRKSFNVISVDGETSTNDSCIAINSGEEIKKKFIPTIKDGINYVFQYLAKAIVRDGEGANCVFEVLVNGTNNDQEAIKIAKSIINSALVKTAIHGSDPNWGRIIAAAGNAGIKFHLNKVDLYLGEYQILNKGQLISYDKESVVKYMRTKLNGDCLINDNLQIILNLNCGTGKAKAWGCDFSKKYVEINSEYTT